jgi:hypothetical protein
MVRMSSHTRLVAPLAFAGLALLAAPAAAVRWDTFNNANPLNAVRWTPGGVWCASSFGLHRFDPATGRTWTPPAAPGSPPARRA